MAPGRCQSDWKPYGRTSMYMGFEDMEQRGIPTETLPNLYKRWGEGGFGQILTGNIMIAYDQLEAMGNPIIPRGPEFSGPRFEAFKRIPSQPQISS